MLHCRFKLCTRLSWDHAIRRCNFQRRRLHLSSDKEAMAAWMPEAGEWVRAFNGEDVTIFHRRLSCLAYRLADRQLRNRTGSERLLLLFFTLLVTSRSSVPWLQQAGSTCCPSTERWHWLVQEEQGCPRCLLPIHRCLLHRHQIPITGGARTAPWWTPLGSSCKVFSLWWLSARSCVSMANALLCQISDTSCWCKRVSSNSNTPIIKCDIDFSWEG